MIRYFLASASLLNCLSCFLCYSKGRGGGGGGGGQCYSSFYCLILF